MSNVKPFKEDFFERIVDVNWMMEPKVFWMAGAGMFMYTSPDGKKWNRHRIWHSGDFGHFDGIYTGLWMRTGFNPDGEPIWIMAGVGSDSIPLQRASIQNSSDGLHLDGESRFFDYGELCQVIAVTDVSGEGGGKALMNQTSFYVQHQDVFSSADGLTWSPQQYHPDPPLHGGGLSVAPASESEIVSAHVAPDPRFIADGGGGRATHYVPILAILVG